jgi:cyanophycinase-like exopeptidase
VLGLNIDSNSTMMIQIDREIKLLVLIVGAFSILLINRRNGCCDAETRETNIVMTVRNARRTVVNISAQYEIRKNFSPFSGYAKENQS